VVSALAGDVRIIPVLVGGAAMPEASDLPAAIRPLAFRNAVEIDDRHFRSHLESLQEALARFAQDLADQRTQEASERVPTETEPDSVRSTLEPAAAAGEASDREAERVGVRDSPSQRQPSAGTGAETLESSAARGNSNRNRWPTSVLVASVAVGGLAGLLAVAALLALRDGDGDDEAGTATSGAVSATTVDESESSITASGVVEDESFVVFETDRDDPSPDPAQRRRSIWRVNVDGSDDRVLIASDGSDGHPTLSSDGRRIAHLHTDTPEDVNSWELVVADVDGSSPRVLVEGVHRNYRPSWSPDDASIIIPLSVNGQVDLWRIDVSTGERQQVTDTPEPEYDPDWSSNGLVFRRDVAEDAEIFTSDVDGSNERRLTENPGYDSDPRWSPDGTHISFTRAFGPGNLEVSIMDRDGSNVVNLTDAPGSDQDAMWLSTGAGIVFVSSRDGYNQLYMMDGDGSNQRRLMESASQDVAPDGW
jgi:TolB protein